MALDKDERELVALACGRAIRQMRHEAGMSQEALAAEAHIDRTYPSLMERGLRQPTIGIFLNCAVALKITAKELLDAMEYQVHEISGSKAGNETEDQLVYTA